VIRRVAVSALAAAALLCAAALDPFGFSVRGPLGTGSAEARPAPLRGWVGGFTTTEYHPTPEHWFAGPRQSFRGLRGEHRVAWLISAHGVAMQGDGWSTQPTGPGTRWANYVSGAVGWLNARARPTRPGGPYGWSNGAPAWLACGW